MRVVKNENGLNIQNEVMEDLHIISCANIHIESCEIRHLKISGGSEHIQIVGTHICDGLEVVGCYEVGIFGCVLEGEVFIGEQTFSVEIAGCISAENRIVFEDDPKHIHIAGTRGGWIFSGMMGSFMKEFNTVKCQYKDCGMMIFPQYAHIIKELKKAGLLDKQYPLLCCKHYQDLAEELEKVITECQKLQMKK